MYLNTAVKGLRDKERPKHNTLILKSISVPGLPYLFKDIKIHLYVRLSQLSEEGDNMSV